MSSIISSKSIKSMFLFSCIPVCLLPLLLAPASTPVSFFPLIPFPALPTSLLTLGSPSSSFPLEELYSVADIFPASLDKNKGLLFCLVPRQGFCLSNKLLSRQQQPAFCHCQSTHAFLRNQKKWVEGEKQEANKRRKCFLWCFLSPC